METVILDLDNCISNDLWRIPHIQMQHSDLTRRYHDYHSLSAFDEVGNHDLFETPHKIAILTGRPAHYKTQTIVWLVNNHIAFDHLIMRNNEDHSPSAVLKQKQLGWLIEYYDVRKSDIVAAYDDRLDVVEMYRANGLTAYVRQINDLQPALAAIGDFK